MRVYVLSVYPTVRAGLSAIVREQAGWHVIGASAPEALMQTAASQSATSSQENAPDILLVDLDGVPDIEGIETWLAALQPRAGIIALGSPDTSGPRERARQEVLHLLGVVGRAAEQYGITFGLLRRNAPAEAIVAALTAVEGGLITLDPQLGDTLIAATEERIASLASLTSTEEPLTPRELEVLQLMALGLPNKTIAARLHVSEHTAKFHVSSILMKLGAASRTEAVTLGARRGLLIL